MSVEFSKDDVSRLFPYAASLLAELGSRAVIVLSYGSPTGANGCAPAFMFDMKPSGAAKNTEMLRSIREHLRAICDRMEDDVRKQGVPLEDPQ